MGLVDFGKVDEVTVSKIAILIERYKRGASVGDCVNFIHPAQKELNDLLITAKQHSRENILRVILVVSIFLNIGLIVLLYSQLAG